MHKHCAREVCTIYTLEALRFLSPWKWFLIFKCLLICYFRYSILTVVSQDSKQIISTPLAYKAGDGANSGLSKDHVCSMIEETIKQCSRIYDHCFSEAEMR